MNRLNALTAAALFATTALTMAPAAQAAESAEDFVKKAAVSSEFEIQSSKLALEKSQDAEVKKFAQTMIDDHTKASNELKATLPASGVNVQPPATLDDKHQKMLDELKSASGTEFDDDYIDAQAKAHDEAVSLFSSYAEDGDNEKLKGFASKTLPTLKSHQEHVEHLEESDS